VRGLVGGSTGTQGRIYVPGIDRSPVSRYSYSPGNFVGLGDVLTISAKPACTEDLRYLLAWLNSTLVEEWYRIKGQRAGRGCATITGQSAPFPIVRSIGPRRPRSRFTMRSCAVGELLAGASGERRVDLERQVNQLISRLLTPPPTKKA